MKPFSLLNSEFIFVESTQVISLLRINRHTELDVIWVCCEAQCNRVEGSRTNNINRKIICCISLLNCAFPSASPSDVAAPPSEFLLRELPGCSGAFCRRESRGSKYEADSAAEHHLVSVKDTPSWPASSGLTHSSCMLDGQQLYKVLQSSPDWRAVAASSALQSNIPYGRGIPPPALWGLVVTKEKRSWLLFWYCGFYQHRRSPSSGHHMVTTGSDGVKHPGSTIINLPPYQDPGSGVPPGSHASRSTVDKTRVCLKRVC